MAQQHAPCVRCRGGNTPRLCAYRRGKSQVWCRNRAELRRWLPRRGVRERHRGSELHLMRRKRTVCHGRRLRACLRHVYRFGIFKREVRHLRGVLLLLSAAARACRAVLFCCSFTACAMLAVACAYFFSIRHPKPPAQGSRQHQYGKKSLHRCR